MKRKLLVPVLALLCVFALAGCCFHSEWSEATCTNPKTCVKCGETEGEALDHSWVDASCTDPKTCALCAAAEGEALGHAWQDATTEAPKTCAACALTEGDRIITDPRFTTASTAGMQGTWVTEASFSPGMKVYDLLDMKRPYYDTYHVQFTMTLANDGTRRISYIVTNEEEIVAARVQYHMDYYYEAFAKEKANEAALELYGISKEEWVESMIEDDSFREKADQAILDYYGMSTEDWVKSILEEQELLTVEFDDYIGVYYVEGDQIHTGSSWDAEMTPYTFRVEGDTLSTEMTFMGHGPLTFTRITE